MLYFFTGDDEFAVEQAVTELRAQYQVASLYFSRFRFSSDSDELNDQLISAATFTLDGSTQLLWLKDLPINSTTGLSTIQSSLSDLAHPQAPSIVVISSSTVVDGRLSLAKWLKAHAECRDFPRLALWQTDKLVAYAQSIAAGRGIQLTLPAAQALIAQVGNDSRLIHQAIDLLLLYEGAVTSELVNQLIPSQSSDGIAFSCALLERDVETAIAELERILMLGDSPLRLIALTLSQVRLWLGVKAALSVTPYADHAGIARAVDLSGNPNRVYYLKQEVAQVSLPMLVGLLKLVVATEKTLKSSGSGGEVRVVRQLALAVGKAV